MLDFVQSKLKLFRGCFVDGEQKAYFPARVVSKQYCMAKKDSNRFGVPVDTKFYRVKVTLLPASPT